MVLEALCIYKTRAVAFTGQIQLWQALCALAVGAALACKLDSSKAIAVAYLGDGAVEEGVVHESMNLASEYNELLILFVVEKIFLQVICILE